MVDFEELTKEYVKCMDDKSRIYMITHFLKTYDATQTKNVPFNLFPRQQDLCKVLGNANNVVTTKARQQGITTTCGGFISCEIALTDPSSPITVLVIGNTLDLAQQMVTKIKDFLLQFPRWIWGDEYLTGFHDEPLDPLEAPSNVNEIFKICNQKELYLKNGCKVVARSSGPNASRGVGGVNWLIFDEAAFIENGNDVYASAIPTVSTGGHVVMISTPNGKDMLYYETCRLAKLKGTSEWNNFELVEMKWYHDPRYNKNLEWTRKNTETGDVEIQKENYINANGDVKFDPDKWYKLEEEGWKPRSPWYIKMCQQFNNDSKKIAQELDVSFLGSASNVVEPEFIEMQTELNKRDPLYIDPIEEDTWIWKTYIPEHTYIMSIDCSRGDAADRTAIEILDINGIDEDGTPCIEQVLEYHGKKSGDIIGEMAYQYGNMYGQAFCIVDCVGGTGDACILTMMRLGYKNLYYDDPLLKTYTIQREASSIGVTSEGKLPGFHSSSVRFQMLTNFANMVKTNQIKIRSKRVLAELDTWIYKGTAGRIDHQDGCHDDTLTCLAMGMFVMQFSIKTQMRQKELDKVRLSAFMTSANLKEYQEKQEFKPQQDKKSYAMPIYGGNKLSSKASNYMWLIK